MKTETKKPGLAVRALGMLFPFRKPAQQALQPAVDGAEITRVLISRLQASIRPTPKSTAPQCFADAQALWREAATRHGLDAQKIQTIQTDLDRRWGVIFLAGIISFAIGVAGVILLFIDGLFPAIGYASSLFVAGYAMASLLRTNLRRSQVRARALVTFQQYRNAAGSVAAMLFNDVRLNASNTTCK